MINATVNKHNSFNSSIMQNSSVKLKAFTEFTSSSSYHERNINKIITKTAQSQVENRKKNDLRQSLEEMVQNRRDQLMKRHSEHENPGRLFPLVKFDDGKSTDQELDDQ